MEFLLKNRVWPGGAVVFGTVIITAGLKELPQRFGFRMPATIINVAGGQDDPEHPILRLRQGWNIWVLQQNEGDTQGRGALVGANRVDGKLSSSGRGLLEIEEQYYSAIGVILGNSGMNVFGFGRGPSGVVPDPELGYVAYQQYNFSTKGSNTTREYFKPTRLAGVTPGGGGSGSVDLTWKLQPDRYDRFNVILRRDAGATPPATPTSGTSIVLGSALPTSFTDTPGVGVFSYSLFAGYDEDSDPPDSADVFSAGEPLTITVV